MKITSTPKHPFSLVELLVAVAVLSLMMTFLFQFIISSQRIWSGTSNAANVYAQAQVALDVIGNDLQNLRFSNEPAQQCPFFFNQSSNDFCLAYITHTPTLNPTVSTFDSNAETYLVIIKYNHADNTLKRIVLDPAVYSGKIFFYYGWPFSPSTAGIDKIFFDNETTSPLYGKENQMDVLAEDVINCTIATYPSPTLSGYATVLPKALRLTLDIYDGNSHPKNPTPAERQKAIQATSRSFTRLIFLR